jgi:hypothetical protein
MSYCRWSSDNWRCELYCYESNDGFVTHIASNKIVGDVPEELNIIDTPYEEWIVSRKAAQKFMNTAERRNIGLEHDGETFVDEDLDTFLLRLLYLRKVGYKFPDYVIDEVRAEIAEEKE